MLLDWLEARSKRVFQQTVGEAMVFALAMNDPEALKKIANGSDRPDIEEMPKWWEMAPGGQRPEPGN